MCDDLLCDVLFVMFAVSCLRCCVLVVVFELFRLSGVVCQVLS